MVYVFLAEGFEIIEALSPVDMLRRAGVEVRTVGVTGSRVKSSCGVEVKADIAVCDVSLNNAEALVIPGGIPGVPNLEASDELKALLFDAAERRILICAICAGPSLLGKLGLLRGKRATAYPGFEKYLEGAQTNGDFVVRDGDYITAKGAGVSVPFGLEIVKALRGEEEAQRIKASIQCK